MLNFKNGALIAIAAGSLFASACKKEDAKTTNTTGEMTKPADDMNKPAGDMNAPAGDEKTAKIACMGVNECKGQGACKTEANACGGQNGCGGKGFVEMTEEECKAKGGTVMAKPH